MRRGMMLAASILTGQALLYKDILESWIFYYLSSALRG
jgi:hypothetical protein